MNIDQSSGTWQRAQKENSPLLFNRIAARYDLLNRILSLGMDVCWRKRLLAHFPRQDGLRVLDLASGTGDVTFLAAAKKEVENVTGIDLSDGMLARARDKARKVCPGGNVIFQKADAQALPFADRTFDIVTVAFGVRNFPDLMKGLAEAMRVLKDGGRLIILEFGKPSMPVLREGHAVYLRLLMPAIAFLLTGQYDPYLYLAKTINVFPYGTRFARIIKQVGFSSVRVEKILQGTAMIYEARK